MRTAFITGAARGIGLAAAKRFQKEGWNVAIIDIDGDELKVAEEQLPGALVIHGDVADENRVAGYYQQVVGEFGGLHALVNNAGLADFGPIEETNFERWRAVMRTNIDGVFLMSQAAIPYLKQQKDNGGAAIVNIASISGLRASTLRVAYGTSKAAVKHLTLQQAAELGEYNIRANSIAPGPVRTKLAMAVHTQDIIDAYHDAIPLNRYGSEDEIANAIWFLCSPEASYITGQLIAVDGGFEGTGIGLPSLRRE